MSDALKIFFRVSSWVVIPVIVALIAGKWLDAKFDTTPWIFLIATGFAFLISIYGIIKVIGTYIRSITPPKKGIEESSSQNDDSLTPRT